ncbi:hypothetical protein ABW21_db0202313 [Orbilia brochopaga]|nr:hypothetical protein ABW21_db0202313 [Drechslerella brochopaga]
MLHSNGAGCDTSPATCPTAGSTSSPVFGSLHFPISNTARLCAITKNMFASAEYRPGHTRLPNPKAYFCGSSSSSAAAFVPRNLSGLNCSGSEYILGSRANHAIDGKMIEPLGIRYPRNSSSSFDVCGRHSDAIGIHRHVSFSTASTYGSCSRSSNPGSLAPAPPTTRSISSCAFLCTSGNSAIARKKYPRFATVVSAPPAYSDNALCLIVSSSSGLGFPSNRFPTYDRLTLSGQSTSALCRSVNSKGMSVASA